MIQQMNLCQGKHEIQVVLKSDIVTQDACRNIHKWMRLKKSLLRVSFGGCFPTHLHHLPVKTIVSAVVLEQMQSKVCSKFGGQIYGLVVKDGWVGE